MTTKVDPRAVRVYGGLLKHPVKYNVYIIILFLILQRQVAVATDFRQLVVTVV